MSNILDINIPNNSNDKHLINEVATQLHQFLPTLSYGLCSEISNKRDEEAAVNAALAWYQQQITRSATENVVQELDNEHISNPTTIQDLINTTVKQAVDRKVASIKTKLKKNIEKNLQKKLGNPQTNQLGTPDFTHWSNKILAIQQQPANKYFAKISNLTFHNLCNKFSPPPGTHWLLGLGPKFIPQWKHPQTNLTHTFTAFVRDVRSKYNFAGIQSNQISKNEQKIYIKSDWEPDVGNIELESRLTNFQQLTLALSHANSKSVCLTKNINQIQYKTLLRLKNNPNIITLLANKNLGPVIMDQQEYLNRVLSEHLLDSSTYQHLTKQTALKHLNDIKDRL